MEEDRIGALAERFGVSADNEDIAHGLSGSTIRRVQVDGRDGVLKITSLESENDASRARRELEVYRTVAGRLPIRTPNLLDVYEDAEMQVLLLTAHGERIPVTDWDEGLWQLLAVDLAHLHSADVPEVRAWPQDTLPFQALREPNWPLLEAFWRQDLGDELDRLIEQRYALETEIRASGDCFVHGDCHTDNVLCDADGLIWVDWQAARIGHPAQDVAFVQSRATPDGVVVPPEFLQSYCHERGVDLKQFQRSVTAAELAVSIFEWPHYAPYNTAERMNRIRQRTQVLLGA